jgi:hypothetical protein
VKITPSQRRNVLIVAALALVAVVLFDSADDQRGAVSAAAAPRVSQPPARGAAAPLPEIPLAKLDEKIPRDPVRDAFEMRSWEPPPQPPKVVAPAPPQAPPLPYSYVGKIMEGDQIIVFLAKQDRSYVVKQGETIDGAYKIEDIKGGTLVFTYLPLGQQQILAIGAAN